MSGTPITSHALRRAASRSRVVAIVGVLAVLSVLVVASLVSARPDSRLMLRATFTDASPLLVGNDVRIGGVKVGTIASMRVIEGGAEVMVELDKAALPVHVDARLTIRPVSLLGERYVELDRGSSEAPVLADGGRLGIDQTGSSVDLDEVLNTLDDPTASGLAALVGTLGEGIDGNGEDVARALAALAPAMRNTRGLTSTLKAQNKTLASLVDSLSKVASGVATDNGKQLDRLVEASATILDRTKVNEAAFRSMLAELPGTMRTAVKTLGELESTAEAATPTLKALRPTAEDLDKIGNELLDFANAADPALAAANPVLKKAEALVRNAQPVADLLRQQSPAMLRDVTALDPIARDLLNDFSSVMDFVRGWALTTNGRDGLSHYFRAALVVTDQSVTGLLPGGFPLGASESASGQRTTSTGKQPRSGGGAPADGIKGLAPELLNGVGNLLGGLLAPRTDKTGGVTGLTPRQEAGALDLLLGGS